MDNNESSTDGAGTQASTYDGSRPRDWSWGDYVAGVSGAVVLFGTLIYILGLLALWFPIWRAYSHDVETAWHATFLVPRSMVAALGVRQLVAFPLVTGILIFTWMLFVGYRAIDQVEGANVRGSRRFISSQAMTPLAVLITIYCAWRLASGTISLSTVSFWNILLFLSEAFPALVLLVLIPISIASHNYRQSAGWIIGSAVFTYFAYSQWHSDIVPNLKVSTFDAIVDTAIVVCAASIVYLGSGFSKTLAAFLGFKDNNLLALLVVLACAFIGAFLLTIPSKPSLPQVAIDVKNKDKDVVGPLLTHTENFWYVFNQEAPQTGRVLTAIPDDEVKLAQISEATE